MTDAAVRVLTEAGEPLHYREITRRILDQGLAESASKTPAASLSAVIAVEMQTRGPSSRFVRIRPGVFGLRSWQPAVAGTDAPSEDADQHRVRIPLYPVYAELRHVLRTWDGIPRSAVTHLRATIAELRGTPQEPVAWTEPKEWIPERLTGEDRKLAMAIWKDSKGQVNPQHIYGHWLLARGYRLLDEDGVLYQTT